MAETELGGVDVDLRTTLFEVSKMDRSAANIELTIYRFLHTGEYLMTKGAQLFGVELPPEIKKAFDSINEVILLLRTIGMLFR